MNITNDLILYISQYSKNNNLFFVNKKSYNFLMNKRNNAANKIQKWYKLRLLKMKNISEEIELYNTEFKDNYNIYQTFYFNPIEGKILVFPSHLAHHVEENKSEEDRISVAFNIRLKK